MDYLGRQFFPNTGKGLMGHLSIKLCLLRESRIKHLSKFIHSIFYGRHGFLPFIFAYFFYSSEHGDLSPFDSWIRERI